MESLKKSVVIDFPDLKHVYALIGYNKDTNKVLGWTFKSNKIDAKDEKSYKASLSHALNAIPPPNSEITHIRVTFPECGNNLICI